MFWNSKTPQQKLKKEIEDTYQSTVRLALKQSSESFMQAMYVRTALSTCYDTTRLHCPNLARKYNLTESTVWSTIVECHNSAMQYYLQE